MSRAYVPAALPDVVAWYAAGEIPAGTRVHPVTAAMRAGQPAADDEELEYAATLAAHAEAVAAAGAARPAVVAIDYRGEAPALPDPVSTADWAAVFVDDLLWYAVEEVPHLA